MVLDAVLKAVEAKFDGVEVRAIQDDCDLMGPPEQLFGTDGDNGALQFLLDELAKVDLQPNLTKFQAYLVNPDGTPRPSWLPRPFIITDPTLKAQVASLDVEAASAAAAARTAPPSEKAAAQARAAAIEEKARDARAAVPCWHRAYGCIVCGAALGDDEFIADFLHTKQLEICGDIANSSPGTIVSVVEALAASSAHAASTAIYYSLQCRIDYLLETHLPALTRPLACAVDEALRRAYHLAFEVDLLDPAGQVPGQDDPTFLRDLAGLKVSAGGCGYRCTERRAVFLTSLNNALPQLMGTDRTPALWPSLAPILGADSFKDENTATRWTTFFESSSAWAKAFSEEITRVKALRTTALTAAGYDTASPPESELFDKPNAAFGAGHKKLQRDLFKEICALEAKAQLRRAGNLLRNDQRKLAFEQSHSDKCSNSLFSSTPSKLTPLTSCQFIAAVQNVLGTPLSLLRHLTDFDINSNASGPPQRVDPYGNNLKKLAKSEGDGFRLNHDSFVDILSYWLQRGSLRHKGGKFGRPRTCKGLFTHIAHRFNSQQPAGEQSLKVLQKIIPDIVIDARGGLALDGHGASVFSGRESLVDVKTKTCDAKYPTADGTACAVVTRRATEASQAYLTRARRLDTDLGTLPGAKGPFVTELETFGRGGKVIIPVAGAFAEMSPDVYAIIDLVATALTCEHLSYYDAYPSVVKGMFQQRIYRSLGLAAHLGWARLVIDRTKANIRYPTPGNSPGVADPAEDDVFENENITNPDRAFASSYL